TILPVLSRAGEQWAVAVLTEAGEVPRLVPLTEDEGRHLLGDGVRDAEAEIAELFIVGVGVMEDLVEEVRARIPVRFLAIQHPGENGGDHRRPTLGLLGDLLRLLEGDPDLQAPGELVDFGRAESEAASGDFRAELG